MIVVENLSKAYGTQQVLQGFSATFPTGELSCIAGASGKGKTTLLRLLMGLEQPDSGTISGLDGLQKSAVFQEDWLCQHLDVYANILLPHVQKNSALTLASIDQGLQALGLAGHQHKLAGALSGGMKRRVALLRALLAPYDVLFLDEPFKGLDPATKAQTMAYCKERIQGKTVIFITHDREEVDYFAPKTVIMV